MLSGKFKPTSGTGFLNGLNITNQQAEIRKNLGYAPQFDILLPGLTCFEQLVSLFINFEVKFANVFFTGNVW